MYEGSIWCAWVGFELNNIEGCDIYFTIFTTVNIIQMYVFAQPQPFTYTDIQWTLYISVAVPDYRWDFMNIYLRQRVFFPN